MTFNATNHICADRTLICFILLPPNSACCQWWNSNEKRLATLEFDRTRKSMGVIVKSKSGDNSLLVKVLFYMFFPMGNYVLYSYFAIISFKNNRMLVPFVFTFLLFKCLLPSPSPPLFLEFS
jgi:magnesium-transporting ATPase (P-type)